jgi:meso-butanediol dehydrogenase/(S,S)-butanediol dehydrogenase/diacetyl reductase
VAALRRRHGPRDVPLLPARRRRHGAPGRRRPDHQHLVDRGKRGNPYFGAYTFAKFGIVGLTQSLAAEVAYLGITVNAVCPGTVETDMIDQVRADRVAHGRPEVPAWAEPIPLGRSASAADVAAVVAFLASADASYVTGEAINVDGGRVMH